MWVQLGGRWAMVPSWGPCPIGCHLSMTWQLFPLSLISQTDPTYCSQSLIWNINKITLGQKNKWHSFYLPLPFKGQRMGLHHTGLLGQSCGPTSRIHNALLAQGLTADGSAMRLWGAIERTKVSLIQSISSASPNAGSPLQHSLHCKTYNEPVSKKEKKTKKTRDLTKKSCFFLTT